MLPSTGYFKGINCPFYDSGLCERPYCHFRHVRKEQQNIANEGIGHGAIFHQLVSEAVKKVLQHTDSSNSPQPVHFVETDANASDERILSKSAQKVTYNPTPISQLQKTTITDAESDSTEQRRRHIPVPYTPRKPASLPRPVETNGDTKPFIYIPPPAQYLPGTNDGALLDPYMPKGGADSKEKYVPGIETELQEYKPVESKTTSKVNYVPSDKSVAKKRILEYKPKPTKVSSKGDTPVVTYQPTPRSQVPCFSSDEDEPDSNKKRKLSTDLNSLDELGAEFDIIGQILDEERYKDESRKNVDDTKVKESKLTHQSSNDSDEKQKSDKQDRVKSDDKETKKKSRDRHTLDEEKCKKESRKSVDDTKDSKESKHSQHTSDVRDEKQKSDKHIKTKSDNKEKDKKSRDKHSLDVEKGKNDSRKSTDNTKENKDSKLSKQNLNDKDKKQKSDKYDKVKSDDNKDKRGKDKHDKSNRKSLHKGSSKDKDRDNDKERKKDNDHHKDSSQTKRSHSSSKPSSDMKINTSKQQKSSDKSSNHSSSSKSKSHEKKDKYTNDAHKSSHKSSKEKSRSKDNKDRRKEKQETSYNIVSDTEFHDVTDINEEIEEISESDEEAIALQCKKIFEEYVPTKKVTSTEELPKEESYSEEYVPTKKRVSRTADKNMKIIPKAAVKPDFKKNAAEKMAERLTKIREFHAARNSTPADVIATAPPIQLSVPSTITAAPAAAPSKIRIAHVPYASFMLNSKKAIPAKPQVNKSEPSTSTAIQTVKKGTMRVAHMPNEKFIDRPGVLEPLASKIPANIRSTYLNMMIDECLKIYLTATDAYARAQHEELTTSKKCTAIQIYKNSAVLTVSRLRKEVQECNGIKKSGSDCSMLQKIPSAISGTSNNANAGSWSIENKFKKNGPDINELRGAKFYANISKWILSEEQLQDNGFPRSHPSSEKGRAMIYSQNKKNPPKGIFRPCCRCGKEYTVDKKGFPTIKEECIYHPNRKYRFRGEVKYQCCSQDGMSDGCCVAPCHVYEYVDYDNLKGYVRTMTPERAMDDYGVYSLDCEMCYTTQGLDLTRITVIDSACKVVYETLIKPLHPIIDYNTRYSGITEEHMANVRTTLLEVQATLLSMFNSKTILIGHSLESDFKALKIIHDTVIDTSVLFPHKMGPPYKRALRNLSSEYLKKIIQNSVEGHDSAEDATVCMELIHYKLKEDLKTR